MSSTSCFKDCLRGSDQPGQPGGQVIDMDGDNVYVATPSKPFDQGKAVIFLTNVFGLALVQNRLLADKFAEEGLQVYMPDYLNNDPVREEDAASDDYDIDQWFLRHGPERCRPAIDKTIAYAKAKGADRVGAVGYCIGARHAFDLAFENKLQVLAVNHPSLLKDQDLEKMAKLAVPILFNTCEHDDWFPAERLELADRLMSSQSHRYKRNFWPGETHGFAVRGENAVAREEAFRTSYEWISDRL